MSTINITEEEAMCNLWKSVFGLWLIGMGLGVSAFAQAATANGPYYATPSWDQKLDCITAANCPRFIVLTNWGSAAVLDRETGLVWEQSPSTTGNNWYDQSRNCINLNTGGRTGWRLPTIQELLSLVDRSQASPSLPSGHPFTVVSSNYWSASTDASDTAKAWIVHFGDGTSDTSPKSVGSADRTWCVRGGQGADPQ